MQYYRQFDCVDLSNQDHEGFFLLTPQSSNRYQGWHPLGEEILGQEKFKRQHHFYEQQALVNRQQHNSHPSLPNNDQQNNKNTYEKNICCNITKRIMKAMFDKHYASKVEYFCKENGCKTKSFLNFYTKHKDKSIGIEKLVKLLVPKQQKDTKYKTIFLNFYKWFLRKKYMLYLLTLSRAQQKQSYIKCKNKFLLYLDRQLYNPKGIQSTIE